ncbi:mannose-1-phosphate guanylyltransferase [Candidatus Methylacidithermus pantelleriae]|uniref:Mannose-1-phosphate guanylyltransferase (GDP) n=1 Tax=Candidatus Methylacidithermus pantelleriae TaxID=2744239 RepID=A0A8J2BMS6_9BACT|nr:sugar phosphate nucleotidyltransferase [Candidatus Methylacidithermus pantelleriae]CAF0703106.1 Mannose-1-phosphate guanylyltransferase (GDP) [Candidatus Methylacidithermus pantelleriae]
MDAPFYPCILAGGSGQRFWPLSRRLLPKHLLRLVSSQTLLEQAVDRLARVVPQEQILILTNREQWESVCHVLSFLSPDQIVVEPERRDTGPAAALATGWAFRRDPQSVVGLFPADALIEDTQLFVEQLQDAVGLARRVDGLVTFAITPSWPSPGFGYLELDLAAAAVEGSSVWYPVRRFVEKPARSEAEGFLEAGNFRWNSGMFLWKCEAFLEEARLVAPELHRFVLGFPQGEFRPYIESAFAQLPKRSIDYLLLEKARSVVAVEARFDWKDLGSWPALGELLPKDSQGNAIQGQVYCHGSSGNVVLAQGRIVALCGVSDLVVVETHDAILVCHKDRAEELKGLHGRLPPHLR